MKKLLILLVIGLSSCKVYTWQWVATEVNITVTKKQIPVISPVNKPRPLPFDTTIRGYLISKQRIPR